MALLVVDLRTNFERREFGTVEVHLTKRVRRGRMQAHFVDFVSAPRGDLERGVRVAEVNDLDRGEYLLVIRLLDARGAPIAFRRSLVSLRGNLAVTAVIAR
jgi:hypothetical protein